jgi:hypothetical protein
MYDFFNWKAAELHDVTWKVSSVVHGVGGVLMLKNNMMDRLLALLWAVKGFTTDSCNLCNGLSRRLPGHCPGHYGPPRAYPAAY